MADDGPSRVIVEMSHTESLHEAAMTAGFSQERPLTEELAPDYEWIDWDNMFAPVYMPGPAEIEPTMSPTESATYLLRGTVTDKSDTAFREIIENNQGVIGIYADCEIQVCPVCPGSPPNGDDTDVENLLCVPNLQALGMDGSGVLVAIVDTGVNIAHLNGAGKTPTFDAMNSWAPSSTPAGCFPGAMPCGHGTMVAFDACIAAPNCTILDVALLQSRTQGATTMAGFLSDAVLAYGHLLNVIQAAAGGSSLVVNNSWGMYHPSWDYPVTHPGNYSDNQQHPFNRIVGILEQAGADILFAAGNCGMNCPDRRCRQVTTNAIYGANSHDQVTCVAGVDVNGIRAGYSTIGPGRLTNQKTRPYGLHSLQGLGRLHSRQWDIGCCASLVRCRGGASHDAAASLSRQLADDPKEYGSIRSKPNWIRLRVRMGHRRWLWNRQLVQPAEPLDRLAEEGQLISHHYQVRSKLLRGHRVVCNSSPPGSTCSQIRSQDLLMRTIMLTIRTKGERPTLDLLRARYGLTEEEIDTSFGIVAIDPEEDMFTILILERVASKVQSDSEWDVKGPYSNPQIEPFGPPFT